MLTFWRRRSFIVVLASASKLPSDVRSLLPRDGTGAPVTFEFWMARPRAHDELAFSGRAETRQRFGRKDQRS